MSWKRLTTVQDVKADVNMNNVCYILQLIDCTTLYFIGGRGEGFLSLSVKETADVIYSLDDIRPPSKSSSSPIGF
jgi:hypothetical protein